jgi:group I intron endonuclease
MTSGVYQIKNLVNGKVYIGSSATIKKRWREHKKLLRRRKHHNRYLQHAWNKYGEANFVFEILEECLPEKLILLEQKWMDLLHSCDQQFGYNINPTAGSCLGVKHSEETKNKLRGENRPTAKLTWPQVREIREKYLSGEYVYEKLALEYNISKSVIEGIILGNAWKDDFLTETYFEKVSEIKGKFPHGRVGPRPLTRKKAQEIREKYVSGKYTHKSLAQEYEVGSSTISNILNNKTWKS